MKHILILHPVSKTLLTRMIAGAGKRGWKLSIVTIETSDVAVDVAGLSDWIKVSELNDDAASLISDIRGYKFDAIVPGNEFAVVAADVLAKELGLPGNDPALIEASRDKRLMRAAFAAHGIPQPSVIQVIHSLEEFHALNWSSIPFPVVVKPVNMAMSLFVQVCHSREDSLQNIGRMFSFHKSRLTNYRFARAALVEEYALGQEFSLECIVEDRQVVAVYPTQKVVTPSPLCFELGHCNASPFDESLNFELLSIAQRVADSWSMRIGVMHIELKIDRTANNSIMVIEAGCRIAGGHISDLVEGRYGTSLEEVLMALRLGISARDLIDLDPPSSFFGIKFIFPQTEILRPSGPVEQIDFEISHPASAFGDPWSVNQRIGFCLAKSDKFIPLASFVESR